MKTLIFALMIGLSAIELHAQGLVSFRTTVVPVDNRVRYLDGTLVPFSAGYRAELMWAPDGTPDWQFNALAIRLGSDTAVGVVAGGPAGSIFGGLRTAPTETPGGFALFQVRVWRAVDGASWEEAIRSGNPNVFQAATPIMRVDTSDPTPPAQVPADLPILPGCLTLSGAFPPGFFCIPEPSAIILGLLGAAAWLALRRR